MRNAFAEVITQMADANPRIMLLSGDIGNRLFNDFQERHPDRFLNCGVAEANMISTAAGLALGGMQPVVYTIAAFATVRCLEQIRVDLCYQQLPVTVVGTGAGLAYATLGPTHHSCEDVGLLRMLPNMTIVCPADPVEVRLATEACINWPYGPKYLRLGKKGEPNVHATPPTFQLGKGIVLRPGSPTAPITLLNTGVTLPLTLEVADLLQQAGIEARVVQLHTVKPLDQGLLADVFGRSKLVATIEEHSEIGGLGGAVAEWKADQHAAARLLRFGTADGFFKKAGEQEYVRHQFGLHPAAIVPALKAALDRF